MAGTVPQFMVDEYVLAYHGPLLYEARVSHPFSYILCIQRRVVLKLVSLMDDVDVSTSR